MDVSSKPSLPTTVMGPNYSYVFDFERDFEHEVTKGWFLVSPLRLSQVLFFICRHVAVMHLDFRHDMTWRYVQT